jgi:menaquinol-cytochrome c reductase iron-sulfur subunit
MSDTKQRGPDVAKAAPHAAAHGEHTEDRREFLKIAGLGGLNAGLGLVVAAPAVGCLLYPLGHTTVSGGGEYLPAGKLAGLKEGEPVKVELYSDKRDAWNRVVDVKVGSAWVMRQGNEIKAYSTVCPHLGCAVDYDGDEKKFKCPCHHSTFAMDGKVEEGPAPRQLDELEVKEESGALAIRYERYKQGVSEKEPI